MYLGLCRTSNAWLTTLVGNVEEGNHECHLVFHGTEAITNVDSTMASGFKSGWERHDKSWHDC